MCSCGYINENLNLSDRIIKCPNCGQIEDRDVHSAKNMIEIYDLVISKNLVPMDSREVKLVDFRTSIGVVAKDNERQVQKDETRRCSVFS